MKTLFKTAQKLPNSFCKWFLLRGIGNLDGRFDLKIAQSQELSETEKFKIYQFRYEVYIKELHLDVEEANHEHGIISDALDANAYHCMLFDGQEMIAYARMNKCEHANLAEKESFFGVKAFEEHFPESSMITSYLMIKKEYQETAAKFQLLDALMMKMCVDGVYFNFIDGHPQNMKAYTDLGFRPYRMPFSHGEITPLVLLVQDIIGLWEKQSPLYRVAKQFAFDIEDQQIVFDAIKEYKENFFQYFSSPDFGKKQISTQDAVETYVWANYWASPMMM
jgi:predicted GNAT family N-acyltransferase